MKYKSIISASIIAVMLGLVGCGSGSTSNNTGTGSANNNNRAGTSGTNNSRGTNTDGTITNRINRLFDGTMTDGYDSNIGNYNNDNRYGYGMNGAENIIGNGRNATGYYNNSLTDGIGTNNYNNSLTDGIGTNDYNYSMSDYQSQITTSQTQNNNTTNTASSENTDNSLNMTNTSS